MSGVEGQGMARLGEEVEGRRKGIGSGRGIVWATGVEVDGSRRRVSVLANGNDSGVVSIMGRSWGAGTDVGVVLSVKTGGVVVVVGVAPRRAGWSSRGAWGRRVGCVVSSLSVDRLVCEEFFDADAGGVDCDSLGFAACAGRGGRGRLCGGGSGCRAILFFDTSHSGRGASGSSFKLVPGTLYIELPRFGIAFVGRSSSSFRKSCGCCISAMSSADARMVISRELVVITDSCRCGVSSLDSLVSRVSSFECTDILETVDASDWSEGRSLSDAELSSRYSSGIDSTRRL